MGTVTANGIDISFDVHGVGDRGTVLLICGTGQAAAMWTALGTTGGLTDAGYQVVTFDNRGMVGAACPAPPWTVGDMADDALAVLQAVGPARRPGRLAGGTGHADRGPAPPRARPHGHVHDRRRPVRPGLGPAHARAGRAVRVGSRPPGGHRAVHDAAGVPHPRAAR